ncbi:MAG: hypothetical protein ACOC35_09930, partial [Promethearchaeia archaeon]
MSETEKVFRELLSSQEMSSKHLDYIKSKREKIEKRIKDKLDESLEFYRGGSYARGTMIRE